MPERPTGVRVVKVDGSEILCELDYVGVNEEGCDEWEIATPVNFTQGDRLAVDKLPGRTSIAMPTNDFREL